MKKDYFYIECDCGDGGHGLKFQRWLDDSTDFDKIYCAVYEAGRQLPLWDRIILGFKYMINSSELTCVEVVFGEKDLKRLKKYVDRELLRLANKKK